MTPRSRKPVLVISGTNIHNIPKQNDQNNLMSSLTEEKSSDNHSQSTESNDIQMERSQNNEVVPEMPHSQNTSVATDHSNSLTNTFREYLCSRSILTASSPADSSFSSRTDDYSSFNYEDLSASKMSSSLLHCLNGELPSKNDCSVFEEKELILKPKQFDENGLPIVFETSF